MKTVLHWTIGLWERSNKDATIVWQHTPITTHKKTSKVFIIWGLPAVCLIFDFFIFGFDLFTLFSLSRVLTQGYSNGIEKEKKERFFKKMHCWLTFAVWWRKKSSIAFFLETLAAVNDGEYFSPNLSLLQTWHESIRNQSCILMLHDMFELKHIKNEFLLGLWCCCDLFCEIKVLAWNKKVILFVKYDWIEQMYICFFFFWSNIYNFQAIITSF